jgi:hypothetical protein
MLRWKVGAFGRFEALGREGNNVEVWYGGTTRTTLIPRETFLSDCTQFWNWERVRPPRWLKVGVIFILHTYTHVLQTQIRQKLAGPKKQPHYVDVRGVDLKVRRIQHDYVSCQAENLFIMVPVRQIRDHGY